jgi:hypothetical protein
VPRLHFDAAHAVLPGRQDEQRHCRDADGQNHEGDGDDEERHELMGTEGWAILRLLLIITVQAESWTSLWTFAGAGANDKVCKGG